MHLSLLFIGLFATFIANAQPTKPSEKGPTPPIEHAIQLHEWLTRWHEASRGRAYTGTFVVSTPQAISSAHISHVCDGVQQLERVDTLSGPPRTTVRRNDEVVTFVPEEKLSVHEKRDMLGLFPSILQSSTHTIGEHYLLKPLGWTERVAGFEADVVELRPKDDLRFGYRIWSEKKTALIVKLQTLDTGSRVLEQVAFSALQLDAPVKMNDLLRAMRQRTGYSVQNLDLVRTTPKVGNSNKPCRAFPPWRAICGRVRAWCCLRCLHHQQRHRRLRLRLCNGCCQMVWPRSRCSSNPLILPDTPMKANSPQGPHTPCRVGMDCTGSLGWEKCHSKPCCGLPWLWSVCQGRD
jgi:negative regulator of sigma E activity